MGCPEDAGECGDDEDGGEVVLQDRVEEGGSLVLLLRGDEVVDEGVLPVFIGGDEEGFVVEIDGTGGEALVLVVGDGAGFSIDPEQGAGGEVFLQDGGDGEGRAWGDEDVLSGFDFLQGEFGGVAFLKMGGEG